MLWFSQNTSQRSLRKGTFCFLQQLILLLTWLSGKESTCQCRRHGFDPWVGKIPLEKGMATLSSILAWRIPWTEEPGWLQSMGLQRVRHDWAINTFTWLLFYTYRQLSWILCSQQEQSSFCFCSHPNSFHSFSTQINYFLFLKKLALDLCLHWPISKFCSCDCYLTSRWQITWEW